MSKWGFVDRSVAMRVTKKAAGIRIEEMSMVILDLEKVVAEQQRRLLEQQTDLTETVGEAAELRGYVRRVHEHDDVICAAMKKP